MKKWQDYRNYEVSVWTLQDNYITTLKSGDPIFVGNEDSKPAVAWPQARMQGQIQNAIMELNIDGTQTLSFDIPMYLFINGERIENPNWYNNVNNNTLVSMRKIKVIFNREQDMNYLDSIDLDLQRKQFAVNRTKNTFEFIIMKVSESHELDNLMCHVECEGLAFHELGKVGFKKSLSAEEFYNEYYEWSKQNKSSDNNGAQVVSNDNNGTTAVSSAEPKCNIQYWLQKAGIEALPNRDLQGYIDNSQKINPNKWYYEIRMAHTSLMDPTGSTEKLSNVIYEEGFITDWTDSGLPVNYQEARERQRIVDINESNLYNITQDLAETFQVFCRYEYLYNTNYNITGRIIVFYNNFLQEEEDVQTLMYPNSASKISREMDSSNISTKMFVRSVTNDSVYEGQTTIMDCGANKSKEDYLLNFNYLHDIGTITDQQYKEIEPFELQMRKYNNKLIPMLSSKNVLETLKTNVDAKVTSLTKQIELDRERITENEALIYALDIADGEADGYITRDYRNPEVLTLLKDSSNAQYDTYYVQLNSNDKCRGIDPSSLKLYKNYTQTSTVTYQYNIGFIPYSSNLKNKDNVEIPDNSFSNAWLDYMLEYKGTIGCKAENCVNALPKDNINDGDSYKALNEDYPSPYKINREQWFVYSAANKTWTISNSAGTTNKGLIGKPCDLSNLPDSSKAKKGWVYYVITDTEINGETRKQGTLCIYNGSKWSFKEHPDYEYRKAKNKEITQENIKNLYEKDSNDIYFRTKRAHIHDSATYYVRKINYERTGFYIYKCTTLLQKNGLTSKTYTAERKEAQDGYTRDYIKKARLIYYVRGSGGDAPGQPTIASADTEETVIKSINTINEWSSYLSSPDSEVLSDYLLYKVWEISYNTGRRGFTELKKINQEYQGETYSSASDASGTAISTGLSQAAGQFLKDEDEISNGIFKYDEYHNLDKVTGLFKSDKKGSYYWYGIASTNNVTEDINTLISDTWNAVNEIEFPSTEERKSKYVLIKEQTYYGNGNSAMRYTYKYYDDKDTCVVPENPGTHIQIIEPIFYLNTKSSASSPSTTIDVEKVISSAETDVWTTMFVSATKASQKYYLGWKVTTYDNNSKCYYNRQANDDEFKIKQTKVKDTDTDDIPKYIYAIFRYKPDLYYEKIKESWMNKLQKDISLLEKNQNRQRSLTNAIESLTVKIKKIKSDKENEIAKFEYMMGAALRESYWQPEDEYQDFGSRYEEQFNLILQDLYHDTTDTGTFIQDTEKQQFASVGWDACLFDNEQESFYEYGIEQKKIYYPCIDLTQLGSGSDNFLYKYQNDREKHLYSVFYNPTNVMISDSGEQYDIRYSQYFSINSEVQFAFLRDSNGRVKPILIVLGAETLSDDMLKRLKTTGKLGKLTIDFGEVTNDSNPKAAKLVVDTDSQYDLSNAWIEKSELKKSEIVYPRIIVPSLKLKTSSNNLVLHYTKTDDNAVIDKVLENYEDYYIFTQTYYDDTPEEEKNRQYKDPNNKIFAKYKYRNLEKVNINELVKKEEKLLTYYTITIKPEYLFNNVDLSDFVLSVSSQNKMEFGSFKLFYCLSNADLSIYLDAKEILKENAYPKVSYSIEISRWSPNLLRDLHNKLAQIVMINDTDLKLQNTFGYVSGIKLDLDHEEKDTVEIKNYKTKFEDLFSKIVAETEAMHKSGYNIGLAGALGAGGGGLSVPLNPEGFEATLEDPSIQEQLQEFIQEYFDGPEVVQLQLQDMWDEAGQILASAATSLNSAMSATTKNASILAGFRENVTAALTPKVFTGKEQPTDFKPGDIWMNEEDGYFAVATGYSGRNGGFTRTHDGSLAEIKGANVQFDAETGIVDITGETQINLMSGKSIYIAANDNVDIIGNKSVNIGGVTINLASANIIGDGYSGIEGGGGIHLVSTDYYYSSDSSDKPTGIEDDGYLIEGGTSRVDISGSGIEMASKNGIVIKSGAGIDIKSSDNENVSAITIDKDKGIYLGATKGLTLYAGDAANYYYGPEVPSVIYEGDYWVQTDWVEAYDDTNDKNHVYPTKKRNNKNYYTNLDEENRPLPQDKNYYYANYGSLDGTLYYKKAVRPPEGGEIVWQEILQGEIDLQGATVSLTRDSLLLGMSNIGASSATAISMDIDQIVLAAGKDLGQIKLSDGTVTDFSKADLSGLQIQSNYIGMATGNGENQNRSLFSMKPEKILLGTISNSSEFIIVKTLSKWNKMTERDTTKTYLIPRTDGYYNKYTYNETNETWDITKKVGPEQFTGSYLWLGKEEVYIGSMGHFTLNTNNIKIQSKNLSEKKGTSNSDSLGMGFALGNRLQATYVPPQSGESDAAKAAREAANPDIGLGFWIDGSGNKHLVVDGDITARKLIASSNYGKFIADGNDFGLYDSAGTGLLTIDSSGNITSGGNLTLSAKKHFSINIYDDADNTTYKFKIDTSALADDCNNTTAFSMYCADADTGGGWDHALVGMRFRTSDGLTIRGSKIDFSVGPDKSKDETGKVTINDDHFRITARTEFYDYVQNQQPSGTIKEKSWWKQIPSEEGESTKYYRAIKNKNNNITWKRISSGNKLLWFKDGDLHIAGNLHTGGIFVDGELWEEYWEEQHESWMQEVGDTLTILFTEAGQILGEAAHSLTDVEGLASLGQGVLESFYEDIKTKLTPNTSKGPYHEYYFKTGDIWQQTDVKLDNDGNTVSNLDTNGKALTGSANPYKDYTVTKTYIAMEDWDKVYTNKNKAQQGKDSTNGWNRTQDGRIASLEGAKLDVDAKSGTISLKSGSKIELLAKSQIDISSKELEITASVVNGKGGRINISGEASVNIASGGSINLVTSSAYNGTKAIKIDEDGILIESNAKIEVKTTEGIIIKSASDTDAAAIKLNYKDGIYIGTGKKIDLYSGTDSSGEIKGGSVFSMTPDRILMGVTSTASDITTTAIDIGKDQIILAAGEVSADDPTKFSDFDASKRLEDMALSGVQIKADYIGLAAGTGNSRALVSLAPSKILIGVGEKDNDGMLGSYVLIANDTASTPAKAKFEIGTTGIFRVLSPGFILDNSATDKLYIADNTSWSDATSGIKFHATNGLEVKGKVTATEGQIGPWKINSKYIADDTLNSAHVGLRFDPDKTVAIFAGAPGDGQSTNISNALFKVTKTGKVTIGNDNVNFVFDPSANNDAGSLTINAKSIKINGQESWSRDDIIIMKKDSSGGYVESQSDIETRMKNKGYTDWILIKPYYNAEVRYKGGIAGGDGTGAKVTDAGVNLTISKTYPSATGQSSFGNADWFQYEFSASVYSIYQNGQAITGNISLILKAQSGEKIETVTITTGNFNIAEKETKKISYSSGHIKTNLLQEGYSFSATIKANGTDKTVMLKHDTLEIKCTCDATNGRVPCTVYYYPE